MDPNVFDLEDAALGQAFSENLAASLPSDLPATWTDAELNLGDINVSVLSDLEQLDLGDINNLDIGFEF